MRMDNKFVWIGIGLGAFFWVAESAVHTFVFHEGPLLKQIYSLEPHEIWMRFIVVVLFVGFGGYAQFMMKRRRQAEEAAKGAHAELNQVFQTAADGMRIIDKDYNVLRVNETFVTLSGVSKDEAIGSKCYEVFSGPLCHTHTCPLSQIIEGEEYIECEVEKEHKDGHKIPCILTATPYKEPTGQVIGIVEDFKDITKRKQTEEALQETEKKFRELANLLPQPVYEIDTEGKITFLNHRGFELSGYTQEDFNKGLYALELFVTRDHDQLKDNIQRILEGEELGGNEYTVLRRDGSTFPVVVYSSPIIQEDKIIGVRGVVVDITQRKQAERSIQKARDELEQRVKERTAQLVEANERLQREVEERGRVEETLWESFRRLQLSYDQAIVYARELGEEMRERKRAQRELQKARNELERRVEERTVELVRANKQLRREIEERIQAQEKLTTYHEKLRALASKLSLAEEAERRRIASEVHERIGQNLALTKIKLGTLRESPSLGHLEGAMDEIVGVLDEIIHDTRSLISELVSPVLYELGFVPGVEWLVQQIQKRHGITLDFEDDGQLKPMSDDVRVLLFQAVRELLVNVVKHAQARITKVSMKRHDDQIQIEVEDDGNGFDPAEISPSVNKAGGFGLFSIQERLVSLGGHMQMTSKPGQGTRVTLMAPLKRKGQEKERKAS
jgi:PAS domain S-box-containing protein